MMAVWLATEGPTGRPALPTDQPALSGARNGRPLGRQLWRLRCVPRVQILGLQPAFYPHTRTLTHVRHRDAPPWLSASGPAASVPCMQYTTRSRHTGTTHARLCNADGNEGSEATGSTQLLPPCRLRKSKSMHAHPTPLLVSASAALACACILMQACSWPAGLRKCIQHVAPPNPASATSQKVVQTPLGLSWVQQCSLKVMCMSVPARHAHCGSHQEALSPHSQAPSSTRPRPRLDQRRVSQLHMQGCASVQLYKSCRVPQCASTRAQRKGRQSRSQWRHPAARAHAPLHRRPPPQRRQVLVVGVATEC